MSNASQPRISWVLSYISLYLPALICEHTLVTSMLMFGLSLISRIYSCEVNVSLTLRMSFAPICNWIRLGQVVIPVGHSRRMRLPLASRWWRMPMAAVQRGCRKFREAVVADIHIFQVRQRGCPEIVRELCQLVEAQVDNGQQMRVLIVAFRRFQRVLRYLCHQVVAQVDGRDRRPFGKQFRREVLYQVVR